jgi:S-adenosylmethionine decarboxylase
MEGCAMNALTQLGMVSDFPSENQTTEIRAAGTAADERDLFAAESLETPAYGAFDEQKDYFVERDGMRFAGTHLLVDLWGADALRLSDPALIDAALRKAAIIAGATILHSHFHHFTPNGGVSGVVVLAESHISIHTWPERNFAAVDIFMCGSCDPHLAIPVLKQAFTPQRVEVDEQRRGRVS